MGNEAMVRCQWLAGGEPQNAVVRVIMAQGLHVAAGRWECGNLDAVLFGKLDFEHRANGFDAVRPAYQRFGGSIEAVDVIVAIMEIVPQLLPNIEKRPVGKEGVSTC